MTNKIKLQPVEGKFVSAAIDGKNYEIWLVDPKTMETGTYVSREVAMRLLAFNHPIVSVVPKKENGVFVQQFTAEELAKIKQMKENPDDVSEIVPVGENEKNKELEALVATQATQLTLMAEQLAELKESKGKKGKKAEEPDEE